jgi:predicted dehydrogenase
MVGTGGRAPMFLDPIAGTYHDNGELVGLCDSSKTRRTYHQERLHREYKIPLLPTYAETEFTRMLKEQRPEVVIVCTPDYLHHEYIIKALEFGADVISEKPLTTDAKKCREIFRAVEKSGRNVRTTFNMRWMPGILKTRQLIAEGKIGTVKHIDFEYYLNTSHGADYFRRWHSQKECSGGLLLHKSTHHFDVINWWLDGIPRQVFAMGDLVYYGKANAVRRGEEGRTKYERYTGESAAQDDPFCLTLDQDATMRALYYEAEAETGYIRDRNVFREGINIEDSMSLLIKYRTGPMVTYSLNAYCPNEGFRASICGDGGRIDYAENHASHIITGDKEVRATEGSHTIKIHLHQHFRAPVDIEVTPGSGNHGGGDALIQEQMFSAHPPPDLFHRNAGHEQGAASLLIGVAANLSMESNQPVKIDDLLPLRPEATRLSELI